MGFNEQKKHFLILNTQLHPVKNHNIASADLLLKSAGFEVGIRRQHQNWNKVEKNICGLKHKLSHKEL